MCATASRPRKDPRTTRCTAAAAAAAPSALVTHTTGLCSDKGASHRPSASAAAAAKAAGKSSSADAGSYTQRRAPAVAACWVVGFATSATSVAPSLAPALAWRTRSRRPVAVSTMA